MVELGCDPDHAQIEGTVMDRTPGESVSDFRRRARAWGMAMQADVLIFGLSETIVWVTGRVSVVDRAMASGKNCIVRDGLRRLPMTIEIDRGAA
jgi:hypothetical protein